MSKNDEIAELRAELVLVQKTLGKALEAMEALALSHRELGRAHNDWAENQREFNDQANQNFAGFDQFAAAMGSGLDIQQNLLTAFIQKTGVPGDIFEQLVNGAIAKHKKDFVAGVKMVADSEKAADVVEAALKRAMGGDDEQRH